MTKEKLIEEMRKSAITGEEPNILCIHCPFRGFNDTGNSFCTALTKEETKQAALNWLKENER